MEGILGGVLKLFVLGPLIGTTRVGPPADRQFSIPATHLYAVERVPQPVSSIQYIVNALDSRLAGSQVYLGGTEEERKLCPQRREYECSGESPCQVPPHRLSLQGRRGGSYHNWDGAHANRGGKGPRINSSGRDVPWVMDAAENRRHTLGIEGFGSKGWATSLIDRHDATDPSPASVRGSRSSSASGWFQVYPKWVGGLKLSLMARGDTHCIRL